MALIPSRYISTATQRMQWSTHRALGLVRQHQELASWLVWGMGVVLCTLWVYKYYQPPSGPVWIGQTVRITTWILVTLVIREWLALRWHTGGDDVQQ